MAQVLGIHTENEKEGDDGDDLWDPGNEHRFPSGSYRGKKMVLIVLEFSIKSVSVFLVGEWNSHHSIHPSSMPKSYIYPAFLGLGIRGTGVTVHRGVVAEQNKYLQPSITVGGMIKQSTLTYSHAVAKLRDSIEAVEGI